MFDQGRQWDKPSHKSLQSTWDSQNSNLKFNPDKIQFKTTDSFVPQIACVYPKKVDAISWMDPLKCKRELERFYGMVNYLKHYSS